jgi:hypothetical protein
MKTFGYFTIPWTLSAAYQRSQRHDQALYSDKPVVSLGQSCLAFYKVLENELQSYPQERETPQA